MIQWQQFSSFAQASRVATVVTALKRDTVGLTATAKGHDDAGGHNDKDDHVVVSLESSNMPKSRVPGARYFKYKSQNTCN